METPTVTISEDDGGIIHVVLKPGVELSLEDARENHDATMKITRGREFLILVDVRAARGVTREARAYYADPEVRKHTIAQAMLVDSGVSRVIGNFFIGLNKPSYPIRLFTARDAALAWLKEQAG